MNFLAKVISYVFHPLLMVTYMFSLFALYFPLGLDPLKIDAQWTFILIIFGFTFLLPAVNIGLLKLFGSIKSVTLVNRRERIIPFIFIAILYLVITYLFYSKTGVSFNDNLFKFLLIADALVVISAIATMFYKVSIHSLAAWGFIGIIVPLNGLSENGALFYPSLAAIVITGLVMSSRLQLQVHSAREVMIGGILGLATSFAGMVVLF
ncbi:MAG TPA: hypothetical protein VIN08_22670 [Ohtaekwangia sp.]|uniref:hypothetical protein n=1 Tax=Ohtaekwangia sp. TaxID=2066019 RepID=UPI002F93BB08